MTSPIRPSVDKPNIIGRFLLRRNPVSVRIVERVPGGRRHLRRRDSNRGRLLSVRRRLHLPRVDVVVGRVPDRVGVVGERLELLLLILWRWLLLLRRLLLLHRRWLAFRSRCSVEYIHSSLMHRPLEKSIPLYYIGFTLYVRT